MDDAIANNNDLLVVALDFKDAFGSIQHDLFEV
jgi:hypothetical protein